VFFYVVVTSVDFVVFLLIFEFLRVCCLRTKPLLRLFVILYAYVHIYAVLHTCIHMFISIYLLAYSYIQSYCRASLGSPLAGYRPKYATASTYAPAGFDFPGRTSPTFGSGTSPSFGSGTSLGIGANDMRLSLDNYANTTATTGM
jgi:hypothetical protein